MYNINTKAKRTELLNHIKESRLNKGYKLETFEGLQIFTKFDELTKKYYLEVYCDNSTKPLLNYYYTNEAQMLTRIQTTKDNYLSRQKYKAERKASQKWRLTGAAACADAIRAELKQVFPKVKFSVRSSTFSGGDSVDVSWNDFLMTNEIDKIVSKYQYGSFNGMEDIYEYTNNIEGLAQAKYVSCHRNMSDETKAILTPIAENLYNDLKEKQDCRIDRMYNVENFLYQIFYNSSIPMGAKVTGIEESNESPYFKISLDLTEVKKEVIKPTQAEIKQGSVNVVTYGKGLAVIGETYAIKDKLKAIGGRFNKFLTVGAGWVFTSDKLEEIKTMLLSLKEYKEVEPLQEVQEVSTEVKIYDGKRGKNGAFNVEGHLTVYNHSGQDITNNYKEDEPEVYTTLKDIDEAANSGKIISLCNLFDLVNSEQRKTIN